MGIRHWLLTYGLVNLSRNTVVPMLSTWSTWIFRIENVASQAVLLTAKVLWCQHVFHWLLSEISSASFLTRHSALDSLNSNKEPFVDRGVPVCRRHMSSKNCLMHSDWNSIMNLMSKAVSSRLEWCKIKRIHVLCEINLTISVFCNYSGLNTSAGSTWSPSPICFLIFLHRLTGPISPLHRTYNYGFQNHTGMVRVTSMRIVKEWAGRHRITAKKTRDGDRHSFYQATVPKYELEQLSLRTLVQFSQASSQNHYALNGKDNHDLLLKLL